MVKSRQRKHPGMKSNLNFFRETIVFFASSILWLYCISVLFVMIGSLLPFQSEFIQIVRVILNIEAADIVDIITYFGLGSLVILIYFTFTFTFNVRRKRSLTHE